MYKNYIRKDIQTFPINAIQLNRASWTEVHKLVKAQGYTTKGVFLDAEGKENDGEEYTSLGIRVTGKGISYVLEEGDYVWISGGELGVNSLSNDNFDNLFKPYNLRARVESILDQDWVHIAMQECGLRCCYENIKETFEDMKDMTGVVFVYPEDRWETRDEFSVLYMNDSIEDKSIIVWLLDSLQAGRNNSNKLEHIQEELSQHFVSQIMWNKTKVPYLISASEVGEAIKIQITKVGATEESVKEYFFSIHDPVIRGNIRSSMNKDLFDLLSKSEWLDGK